MADSRELLYPLNEPFLLEVTGAIYKLVQDRQVAKWSFFSSVQSLETEALSSVLQDMRKNQLISDRVKKLGMQGDLSYQAAKALLKSLNECHHLLITSFSLLLKDNFHTSKMPQIS